MSVTTQALMGRLDVPMPGDFAGPIWAFFVEVRRRPMVTKTTRRRVGIVRTRRRSQSHGRQRFHETARRGPDSRARFFKRAPRDGPTRVVTIDDRPVVRCS